MWLQNFVKKESCLNLGPKMSYLSIFDQKRLILVFLGKNLKKGIVIFEICTLKFVYLQNFTRKQKCQNLGRKITDLGIFDQKGHIWVFLVYNFKKTAVIFEISNPWIWLIAKCCERMKMPKFGTKVPYFGVFGL